MTEVVFVGHVTQQAQVEVEALGALPSYPLHTLRLTAVTDNVRVLHTCKYRCHMV